MALYTRYVLTVDAATGNDTQGSGSSASVKDSDSISGTTLVITNVAGGSTVTKADTTAFAGPPVAGSDTIVFTDTVGGLGMFHIGAVSGDNKTLTLIEEPSTGTSIGNPWGVGGYFLTIARAALLAKPTNLNAGADDHVYIKAGSGYSGTVKVTFSNAGSRSRQLVFEGYTTTPGDGGMATYDITATAVKSFEPNANDCVFRNFKLTNSGAVASWFGLRDNGSGRVGLDNIWASSSAATAIGIQLTVGGILQRCRVNSVGGTGGILLGSSNALVFSLVHDCAAIGARDALVPGLFSIVDTCGTSVASGAFHTTGSARTAVLFCTAYNQGTSGDGYRLTDAAGTLLCWILGTIFANNAGFGINRQGVTASFPLMSERNNDFFSNGTPRQNAEDTTVYDTTPTDLAVDPQFTDAANQDFSIGANVQGAVAIDIGNL